MFWMPLLAAMVVPPGPALSAAAAAQSVALADLQTLPTADRRCIRYVWLQDEIDVKRVAFTLRQIGSNVPPVITYSGPDGKPRLGPVVIGGAGLPTLTRVDLADYWSDEKDLKRAIDTWDLLTFDTNFSEILTPDTLKLLARDKGLPKVIVVDGDGKPSIDWKRKKFEVKCKPYTVDGEAYSTKWVSAIRFAAEHINPITVAALEQETVSVAPVVQSDYFCMRALATINGSVTPDPAGDGLFKDVWGGLYYEFKGVLTAKQAGKKKATDLDVLFEYLGVIDDADGPNTAAKLFDKFRSERKVAMMSKVTDAPRMVLILPTRKSLRARGVVFITLDFTETKVDILNYPAANIIEIDPQRSQPPDAMEIIWTEPDGTQGYAMYNGKGALQREVPGDIANDTTIKKPAKQRLQTLGCITCHGQELGWQPLPNELTRPLKRGVDILGDVGGKNKRSDRDTNKRIAGLIDGNVDELLDELRRSTAAITLKTTGPWKESKDQVDIYAHTARSIDNLRLRYWYTKVGAEQALREMHLELPKEKDQTLDLFRSLLPHTGEGLEDPRIAQMKDGLAIPRAQWELCKSFAVTRATAELARRKLRDVPP